MSSFFVIKIYKKNKGLGYDCVSESRLDSHKKSHTHDCCPFRYHLLHGCITSIFEMVAERGLPSSIRSGIASHKGSSLEDSGSNTNNSFPWVVEMVAQTSHLSAAGQ